MNEWIYLFIIIIIHVQCSPNNNILDNRIFILFLAIIFHSFWILNEKKTKLNFNLDFYLVQSKKWMKNIIFMKENKVIIIFFLWKKWKLFLLLRCCCLVLVNFFFERKDFSDFSSLNFDATKKYRKKSKVDWTKFWLFALQLNQEKIYFVFPERDCLFIFIHPFCCLFPSSSFIFWLVVPKLRSFYRKVNEDGDVYGNFFVSGSTHKKEWEKNS